MKRLLIILILTLSFQTLTKADDIRDFEIEGMSIGDSLLDFYDENQIIQKLNTTKQYYDDNKFMLIGFFNSTSTYESLRFHLKTNDNSYKIYQISGSESMNFENCKIKKDQISNELEVLFGSSKRQNGKIKNHAYDKSGRSKTFSNYFNLVSGRIRIMCTFWSLELKKEKNWKDKLTVGIYSKEISDWINNEAYK